MLTSTSPWNSRATDPAGPVRDDLDRLAAIWLPDAPHARRRDCIVLIIAYILMPRIVIGSAYADMRLAPYVVAIGVIGVVPRFTNRLAAQHAVAALRGHHLRGAAIYQSTERFASLSAEKQEKQLAALDLCRSEQPGVRAGRTALPERCWESPRLEHLGAMAIVRREAFVNGQWTMAGAQLLSIKYAPAKGYAEDPTQVMRPKRCRARNARSDRELGHALPAPRLRLSVADQRRRRINWPGNDPSLEDDLERRRARGALPGRPARRCMAMDTPNGDGQRRHPVTLGAEDRGQRRVHRSATASHRRLPPSAASAPCPASRTRRDQREQQRC